MAERDIVERLRKHSGYAVIGRDTRELLVEAVTEIERLRAPAPEREAFERAAQIAEAEEELPGSMPQELYLIPIEDALRAAVRVTKKNIAAGIRALALKGRSRCAS